MEFQERLPRQIGPSYFPTIFSTELSRWIDDFQKLFKQPVKSVFPYPMNVVKVYDKATGKLNRLMFQFALAGLDKDQIKVQLKNKKFLTISVQKGTQDAFQGQVQEFVTNGICYRDSEITFRIIPEIDVDKFKPQFKNGLLTICLYVKEASKQGDVITAQL